MIYMVDNGSDNKTTTTLNLMMKLKADKKLKNPKKATATSVLKKSRKIFFGICIVFVYLTNKKNFYKIMMPIVVIVTH